MKIALCLFALVLSGCGLPSDIVGPVEDGGASGTKPIPCPTPAQDADTVPIC